MKKYVVYYRVSTKGQGESGLGLDAQRAYIYHFLKKETIAAAFCEIESAKYLDAYSRPKLNKAIELCKREGYTLAVAKIDRLSRVTEHALTIYNRLDGHLFSCDIPNLDKFTLTLFMAIADRERMLIAIRTKEALDQKRQQIGEWRISNLDKAARQKGVNRIKQKAEQNENNRRAMALCQLYREKGMSLQTIADALNEHGFRTARGKQFYRMSVKRLLERSLFKKT